MSLQSPPSLCGQLIKRYTSLLMLKLFKQSPKHKIYCILHSQFPSFYCCCLYSFPPQWGLCVNQNVIFIKCGWNRAKFNLKLSQINILVLQFGISYWVMHWTNVGRKNKVSWFIPNWKFCRLCPWRVGNGIQDPYCQSSVWSGEQVAVPGSCCCWQLWDNRGEMSWWSVSHSQLASSLVTNHHNYH